MYSLATRNFKNAQVMWEPTEDSGKQVKKFKKIIEDKYNVRLADFWDFLQWSLEHLEEFWAEVWEFSGIIYSKKYEKVIDLNIPMENSPEWFPGARLNYAENVLRYKDDGVAMIVTGEELETAKVTYAEMYEDVKLYASALRRLGFKKGDRAVGFMSNRKEAVYAMLAAASIGGIWAGALPLMGAQAVLVRFKQIEPKILFTIDRFLHNQEEVEMLHKVKEITEGLPSLEKVAIVPSKKESKLKDISGIRNSCFLDDFLDTGRNADGSVPDFMFEQLPLSHPLFVNYTSGTTGLPKALVHGPAILLSVARDFLLHTNLERDDKWLSVSASGWGSWNMVSTMHIIGNTVVLFEGHPYFLSPTYFWDMVDELKISHIFLTPSVLDELEKKGYSPTEKHHLSSLKLMVSGGSVVKNQNFEFVYKKVKPDIIFSTNYGTTETLGFSMILDHTLKIHKGEVPNPSFAFQIECVDDAGNPVIGEIGEMVIAKPSPSLPLGLWGDEDGSVFKEKYFSKYPGKFAAGDMAIVNPVTKGLIICGRSDDTLKPKGCRFGSSEIYNVVDTFPEVIDSICVSQYNKKGDERAVLFLQMREGHSFSEELVNRIRKAIAKELSIRHVPEVILETPDIPHNLTGKKMEILVKKIINRMPYSSVVIRNPESLQYFFNVPELQSFS